jgi:GT2 family glycosyltransferase
MGAQSPETNTLPSVGFVVVSWNQRQLTLDCLASLQEQEYPNFTVAVVDNGSRDDSVAAIREAYPDVAILENSRNLGVAAANNRGIQHVLASGADYVFLLNNDTIVDPRMLSELVKVAESDDSIGMTAPSMLYFDTPDIIWCGGNKIDWRTGDTTRLHEGEHIESASKLPSEKVDFITSCAVCIKTAVFRDVGMMDERYFIYYDETDFFVRAGAAGWKAIYVPWAKMWHKVSATMGEGSPRTDYYMIRNRFLFLARNVRGLKGVLALTRAALENGRNIAAYTVKSHNGARLGNRDAKLLGVRDAVLGRWGEMRADVAAALDRRRS